MAGVRTTATSISKAQQRPPTRCENDQDQNTAASEPGGDAEQHGAPSQQRRQKAAHSELQLALSNELKRDHTTLQRVPWS